MSYLLGRFLFEAIAAVTKITLFLLLLAAIFALALAAVAILLPVFAGVALFRKKDANNGDASD